jgi:death on curing protein
MQFKLLDKETVLLLHDAVLNPGELEGLAGDKSLEGALSRVLFRIHYGLVSDVFDVAAMYAVAIAQAHVFNDANKRTAHAAMEFVLITNGIEIAFDTKEIGDLIINVAQGHVDETELATWLRKKKLEQK